VFPGTFPGPAHAPVHACPRSSPGTEMTTRACAPALARRPLLLPRQAGADESRIIGRARRRAAATVTPEGSDGHVLARGGTCSARCGRACAVAPMPGLMCQTRGGTCGWSRLCRCRCRCPGPRARRGVAPARSRRCPDPRAARAAAPRGGVRGRSHGDDARALSHHAAGTRVASQGAETAEPACARARRTGRFCHLGGSRLDAAGVTTVPGVAAGCGRLPVAGARGTERVLGRPADRSDLPGRLCFRAGTGLRHRVALARRVPVRRRDPLPVT
jgi:hypothetical protein